MNKLFKYILLLMFTLSLIIYFLTKASLLQLFYIIIIFILFYFLIRIIVNNHIQTTYYKINTDNYISTEIKMVQIADTHSTIYKDNELVNKIKEENPDIILFTGDIADEVIPFNGTEILLEGIKNIAPMYYAVGNHELRDDNFLEKNVKMQSFGVTYLNDEYKILNVKGNNLLIAGINDPTYIDTKNNMDFSNRLLSLDKKVKSLDFKGTKILLSHRPEYYENYKNLCFDLILTGHAHGGQVIIPHLLNGLYAVNQGFFPKYAGGMYKLKRKSKMIVSRGLCINSIPRVFNPPELVVIELNSRKIKNE